MFWQSQRIIQIEEINTTGPSFELRALFLPGAAIDMEANRRSLAARIEALETKCARMTDLLIDGALDKPSFETAKQAANFELTQLRGQLDQMPNPAELRKQKAEYVKRFSTLVDTYRSAKTAERRDLLQNTYAVRHILPGELRLEVRDWLHDTQADPAQNQSKMLTFA